MSTKNDGVALKLIKRTVGLSTGSSDCCGAPAEASQTSCCGASSSLEQRLAAQATESGAASPEQLHAVVRERYGALAREPNASACGCNAPRLYSDEQLAGLPASVADLSLGCGNPVSEGDIRAGDTVLDLGSGGGIDCFLAAKRVGAAGRVIGIDMTDEMLARARANAARLNAHNVEFRQGQIEAMPVSDGEVDVVISNCVINLSPDKLQVFREMFRALKPGGRVSVSDIVTNGPMSALISQSLESWAECVAGASEAEAYRQGLEAVGFVDVQVTPKEGTLNGLAAAIPAGMPFSALIAARKPQAR